MKNTDLCSHSVLFCAHSSTCCINSDSNSEYVQNPPHVITVERNRLLPAAASTLLQDSSFRTSERAGLKSPPSPVQSRLQDSTSTTSFCKESRRSLLDDFEDRARARLRNRCMAYANFRNGCLEERKVLGVGRSPKMMELFRFWSQHLRHSYNRVMYKQFRQLAEEDIAANYHYGMECLFRFYCYGLMKRFRRSIYEDFEFLTLQTLKKGNVYGLQKYWAFHTYRGNKASKPLKMHADLERLLS